MKHVPLILVLYCLFSVSLFAEDDSPALPAEEGPAAPPRAAEMVTVTLEMVNDNTAFFYFHDGLPDLGFGIGPDDAFTTSLYLSFSWNRPLWIFHRLRAQTQLNMFTWRMDTFDAGYRLDFLSLLVRAERDVGPFTLEGMLGVLGRGNFGGAAIQNGFHYIIQYVQYATPYIDEQYFKAGPLTGLGVRFAGELFQAVGFTVTGALYTRGLWDIWGAGRSSLWLGAEARAAAGVLTLIGTGGFRVSGNGGDSLLEACYSGGLFFLTKLCIRIGDVTLGFGLVLNAYGNAPTGTPGSTMLDNRHYIWSITYGDTSRADPLDVFLP